MLKDLCSFTLDGTSHSKTCELETIDVIVEPFSPDTIMVSYLKTSLLLLLALVGNLIAPSFAASNATKELCHPNDKRALLRIKQQLSNTTINLDSWDPATDCCNWMPTAGCDSTTNRINFLSIVGSDTEGGPLPSAIGDLPYLTDVSAENNFVGPIPGSLSKLRRLNSLDLRFNRLSGPIPSFFGTFQNLTELRLANNLFTGTIPPSLGLAQSLSFLELDNNKLTGTIPESFGSLKTDQLVRLSFANNQLSGEIPRSLEKVQFWDLDFSGNNFKGDPSFLFSKDKTAMAFLDLTGNSFSFDMTNLSVTSRIALLYLTDNKIYGSLPEALAKLPDFNFFNVSYNQLCGHIPRGALKKFDKTSYLHNKCLCGSPLPQCK